jgi:hypothetical protein
MKNELIIMKSDIKWLPILFLIFSIGLPLAPYLNRFSISGIIYPAETASILALLCCVTGCSFLSGLSSISSVTFECSENMSDFLFSQGINKMSYIFSKLISEAIISLISSACSFSIYYFSGLYDVTFGNMPLMIFFNFVITVVWTMCIIIISQFTSNKNSILLFSSAILILIAAFFIFIVKPWQYAIWICILFTIFLIAVLFFLAYWLLEKREIVIKFEKVIS